MWALPGPGIEPLSPALAGGFFTTEPPEKPAFFIYYLEYFYKENYVPPLHLQLVSTQ